MKAEQEQKWGICWFLSKPKTDLVAEQAVHWQMVESDRVELGPRDAQPSHVFQVCYWICPLCSRFLCPRMASNLPLYSAAIETMFHVTFSVGNPVIKTGSCTNFWILQYVFRGQFDSRSTSQNSGSTLRTYEPSHPAPAMDYWPDLHYQAQVTSWEALSSITKCLATPITFMPLLHPQIILGGSLLL